MVWGGSLNKDGTDYLRNLREVEKVISFLERLKEDLNNIEKENITKTIEIILEYISRLSEQKG